MATELLGHNSGAVQEIAAQRLGGVDPLLADDIAEAILCALGQPERVAIKEVLVRPPGRAR